MKPDLKSMNRKELEKLKADVEKTLAKRSEEKLKAARAAAAKAAAAHGFTLAELTGAEAPSKPARKPRAKPKGPKAAPKFRNPANADQTWTGRGRKPDWFKSAIEAGATPESMAI